jgi:hypothetical protein
LGVDFRLDSPELLARAENSLRVRFRELEKALVRLPDSPPEKAPGLKSKKPGRERRGP